MKCNDEISVGEYVKFKNGYIGKVENINDFREPSMKYAIDIQKDDLVFVGEDYIVKHSKEIIDLIEEGDYVNGNKVIDIAQAPVKAVYTEDREQKLALIPIVNEQIEIVVTKEQNKTNRI